MTDTRVTTLAAASARMRAEDLWVTRGAAMALRGVSIELRGGRVVALLGPNGAGKSTLLLTLCGLLRPRRGRVSLGLRRIDGLAAERVARLGVAHVPQRRNLFAELTVRENLDLGRFARRSGVEPVAPDDWVERFPELKGRLDTAAGLLSGGQQQLVAVARGLMCRPHVLLCDEPTAALALAARERVLDALREAADAGAAVAVVEQEVDAVLRIADDTLQMRAGSLVHP